MPSLLLAFAILAAKPPGYLDDLENRINLVRVSNDVLPVARNVLLDEAAGLQVEYLSWLAKHGTIVNPHSIDTLWMLDRHPELLWERLTARYSGTLPPEIDSDDLAALCGYGLPAVDIGGFNGKQDDPVVGWLRSPGHRFWLLDPRCVEVGVAQQNMGGGDFATWATFGVVFLEQ